MNTCLYIGIQPETILETNKLIMSILSTKRASEETKQQALKILPKLLKSPNNTSISNCHLEQQSSKEE